MNLIDTTAGGKCSLQRATKLRAEHLWHGQGRTFHQACKEIWGAHTPLRWATLHRWSIAGACRGRIAPLLCYTDQRRRHEFRYWTSIDALALFLARVQAAFPFPSLGLIDLAALARFEDQLRRARHN